MARSFANQVAVITGASSGIGWELARLLAAEGCKVGLIARRREPLEALVQQVGQAGGMAALATADVGDRDQTLAAVREISARLGPVDLLIANAGFGITTQVDPLNSLDIAAMMRVNFLGVVYAIEAVLPEMLRRGRGHLAAVSSLAAYKGMPGKMGYCASKAAVNAFLEGLRIQLHSRGIAVTTICPGFVRTPLTADNPYPMPWLLEADDAARRILRALRSRRKVYNFPWQMTLVTRVARWLPDWLVARGVRRLSAEPPAS
ncbi:MAG TPA: SDR family NAD(P)-dependent oxidoreductase [Gemmataceae bacterium]|nr:SDR family NAD(P)-dependent oxidoreductase [Gemmataceae bacterium]